MLRQNRENLIVLRILDQNGRIFNTAADSVTYTMEQIGESDAQLLKMANEGVFMLCIRPGED